MTGLVSWIGDATVVGNINQAGVHTDTNGAHFPV